MGEKQPLRIYGKTPYSVAVIHGGPGAAGEMAPLALELSYSCGILEPFQTETSIKGQVVELHRILESNGTPPFTLIGFSWGAWLSIIFSATYPASVKKLILIGTPPFDEMYALQIQETRMGRLSEDEKHELQGLQQKMDSSDEQTKKNAFRRFGALFSKVDSFHPLPDNHPASGSNDELVFNYEIFQRVWGEASELRRTGRILKYLQDIKCPVIAIHGDYDPHPTEGAIQPLSHNIMDFSYIILQKCGHKPWIEQEAAEVFYYHLRGILSQSP